MSPGECPGTRVPLSAFLWRSSRRVLEWPFRALVSRFEQYAHGQCPGTPELSMDD